jgi:predicted RNase H-like nuclease (RuvC/YqgF family)
MTTYKAEVEMWQKRYNSLKQKYTEIEKSFFKSNCELESIRESSKLKEVQTQREFERRVDKIKDEFEKDQKLSKQLEEEQQSRRNLESVLGCLVGGTIV